MLEVCGRDKTKDAECVESGKDQPHLHPCLHKHTHAMNTCAATHAAVVAVCASQCVYTYCAVHVLHCAARQHSEERTVQQHLLHSAATQQHCAQCCCCTVLLRSSTVHNCRFVHSVLRAALCTTADLCTVLRTSLQLWIVLLSTVHNWCVTAQQLCAQLLCETAQQHCAQLLCVLCMCCCAVCCRAAQWRMCTAQYAYTHWEADTATTAACVATHVCVLV